MNGIKTDKSL